MKRYYGYDEEMVEMVDLIRKYSRKQLIKMLKAVKINDLQEDMVKNGATNDELRTSSELWNDFKALRRNKFMLG